MMNLAKRILGGVIILIVLLGITYLGHIPLSIGITIFSLIAIKEMVEAVNHLDIKPPKPLLMALTLMIMAGAYSLETEAFNMAIIFSIVIVLIYTIFNTRNNIHDMLASLFILMYVPVLMGNIIRIEKLRFIWLLYITAWGSDTFAYLVGSAIGKHKISSISHISPNKTIEGSIGGVVGAVILNLIYLNFTAITASTSGMVIFSIIAALLSQIGDLVASFIKRQTGIKDFGNLIPGHGGIMDRFDSMIFIAPLLYLFSIL